MIIYAVSSLRIYENDEVYYGTDGLFASKKDAEAYIRHDIDETLDSNDMRESAEFSYDEMYIRDGNHYFAWQLELFAVPDAVATALSTKQFAVVTTYSWDDETSVTLCESEKSARSLLKKLYDTEVASDLANGFSHSGAIAEDGMHATIVNYRKTGEEDVTVWHIAEVSGEKEVSGWMPN